MAEPLTTAIVLKALSKPIDDIYGYGKGKLNTNLQYLRNEKSLKDIAKRLHRIEKVKTFWSDNKEVDISEFYYPSRIVAEDSPPTTVSSLAEFPPGLCFVIEGTVGQGKSIFMRYLATQELRKGQSSRIPILAELRFLQPEETLETFIFNAFEATGLKISKELFGAYADSGRIVLFLDAFDEIDQSLVRRTIRDLERLLGQHPALQVVVSARPKSGIQQTPGFRVVRLAALTKRDHQVFIQKLTNNEKQTAAILKAISKSSASIDDLLTTPLLLTLMVILYVARQHIPHTVSEFYSELFDVLFYKHDRTKSGFVRKRYVDVGEQKIKRLFEGVCFYSVLKPYRSFKSEQFVECVEHACKHCAIDVDVAKFRDELVKTACLLKEEGAELSFIHKSVQEFYAASFVARSADDFAEKFYKAIRESSGARLDSWRQPLDFLGEIDEWRYAKFYWLPVAEEIAKQLEVDLGIFYSPDYKIERKTYLKLIEGTQVALVSGTSRNSQRKSSAQGDLDLGNPLLLEFGYFSGGFRR
ncbi:hypothetical protein BH10PSE6_BH10PSE6_49210 [soil metagenome]